MNKGIYIKKNIMIGISDKTLIFVDDIDKNIGDVLKVFKHAKCYRFEHELKTDELI